MPRTDDGPLPSNIEELRRLPPGSIIEIRGSLLCPPIDKCLYRLRVEETPIAGTKGRRIKGRLVDRGDMSVVTYAINESQLFRVFREVGEKSVTGSGSVLGDGKDAIASEVVEAIAEVAVG